MLKQSMPLDAQPVVASSTLKGLAVSPSGRLIPQKRIGDFMHCYGTVTGRFSSKRENLSNEPKPLYKGNLKQMIAQQDASDCDWSCHPLAGDDLTAIDYSAVELRLLSSIMKE